MQEIKIAPRENDEKYNKDEDTKEEIHIGDPVKTKTKSVDHKKDRIKFRDLLPHRWQTVD